MNPIWKTQIAAFGGSLLAITLGWRLANGEYGVPFFLCAITGAACIVAFLGVPLDAAVLGGLIFGNVVGNRGFAQLSLAPGLPLLPAEAGLAICCGWLVLTAAFRKQIPVRRDALNLSVGLWIVIGSIRIIPDLRAHGFVAIRDFAMVYYAAFFFIAQAQAEDASKRHFLERCLLAAVVVVIPLAELFHRFPEFFLGTLVVGGIPLIYYKGDLLSTFVVVGVVLAHRRWEDSRKTPWLLVVLGGFASIVFTGSRSSLLALSVATGWLVISGRMAMFRTFLVASLLGAGILLGAAGLGKISAHENVAVSIYERVLSITDFSGQRDYLSEDVESKGGNNRFRLVWWEAVIEETLAGDPWLGLGFGHDLAASFVRRYYPDSDEEFTARSPHCVVVTVFGRMGLIGLLAFMGMVAAMCRRTWAALHSAERNEAIITSWMAPWVVLISAVFGVVLEGPMGAVIFWSALGLAAREPQAISPETAPPGVETTRSVVAAVHG